MRELNKDFLADILFTVLFWLVATPMVILAHKMPAQSILETTTGLVGIVCMVCGIITLVFGMIRRFVQYDK